MHTGHARTGGGLQSVSADPALGMGPATISLCFGRKTWDIKLGYEYLNVRFVALSSFG